MEDLIRKVEAILFAVGKKMELAEIAKLCRKNPDDIEPALKELQKTYGDSDSSLMIVQDGSNWKLTTRESYMPLVKRIVADTELSKTVIETLAVVAWKQPIKQSDVIKIRTNKAYNHLVELEELGFIMRKKHGRTKLIRLTEKFMKYFELEGDKDLEELFKKSEVKAEKAEAAEKLEVIDESKQVEVVTPLVEHKEETLGKLEVYDGPSLPEEVPVEEKKESAEEPEEKHEEEPENRTEKIFGEEKEEEKSEEEAPEEEKEEEIETEPSKYNEEELAELEKQVVGEKKETFDSGEEEENDTVSP